MVNPSMHRRDQNREPIRGANPDGRSDARRRTLQENVESLELLLGQAAKLQEQAELLDLANDAIFIRKLDGTVCYWNEGAERLYGWTRKEVLDQPLSQFLKTEYPLPLMEIKEALLRERKWEGELVHTRRDGSKVTVASRWTLWRTSTAKPKAGYRSIATLPSVSAPKSFCACSRRGSCKPRTRSAAGLPASCTTAPGSCWSASISILSPFSGKRAS